MLRKFVGSTTSSFANAQLEVQISGEKDEILFANDKNEESVVRSRSKSIALRYTFISSAFIRTKSAIETFDFFSYITESLTSDSEEDKKSGRFKTIKKPSIRHEQPTRRKSRSRSPYSRQTNSRIEHSSRHRTSKDPRANRNRIPKVLKSTGKMKLASSGKLSEVVRTESTSGVQTTLSTKGNLICTYIGESRKSIEVQVAVTKPTERPKVSIRDRLGPKVDRPTDDLRSLLLTKRSIVGNDKKFVSKN